MATDEEIMKHRGEDPETNAWVTGPPVPGPIVIAEPDPTWPATFKQISAHIRGALGHETPKALVHVFGPHCPETIRHRLFRDWLRLHPEDRELYVEAKRSAAAATTAAGGGIMDYNRRKENIIRAIYERLFSASGLTAAEG